MAMFNLRLSTNEVTRILLALENDSSTEALETREVVLHQRNERSNNDGAGHPGEDGEIWPRHERPPVMLDREDDSLPPYLFDATL